MLMMLLLFIVIVIVVVSLYKNVLLVSIIQTFIMRVALARLVPMLLIITYKGHVLAVLLV